MPGWVRTALIILLLLLPVEAITGLWFWATGRVIEQTNAWVAARRAEGMRVTMGPPSREGWPLEARIRVAQASLATAPPKTEPSAATYRLEAEFATIGVRLWAPQTLHVGLEGQQRLVTARGQMLPFTTTRTELTLPLSDDPVPETASMVVEGLKYDMPAGPVGVGSIRMHGDFQAAHSTGSLQIDDLDLPPTPVAAALGGRIGHFGMEMVLDGPTKASPAAWRAAGGALHLPQLSLSWGKLGVTAHGDGQLDDNLQPEGSLTARVTGAPETLDALVAARLVQPQAASAARALLGLMLKPQGDGTSVVELPFTLKNQRLQMGQFPLTRIPDATW